MLYNVHFVVLSNLLKVRIKHLNRFAAAYQGLDCSIYTDTLFAVHVIPWDALNACGHLYITCHECFSD